MRLFRHVAAICLVLLFSQTSYAAYACSGQVRTFGMNTDGSVYVDNGYGIWVVCNLHAQTNIPPTVCKGWYSMMVAAQARNAIVDLYFDDGKSCTQQSSWVVLAPYFIAVRNQ
ncbi:hypothetical protein ACTHR6_25545 [Ralstonia holmesii]|uniref:Secreted protein n=1 Tax=Ralstonia holmesii TaxID=3058602 RepID=A0ABC8QJJ0_9RALS|nr:MULTISPECIES: hypothetical protein [Ralstonia]CAJ0704164.1 hypothetical protein R11007_04258 [Ralstonia sp. LMG 32967]CAJ0806949.1 hypothetical protein LMG18096_04880 [Ralstonia sp. LMG 32967]CAJ0821487.1 hypothetical protein LMG18093_04718 [Ralstonia sp. LMG 32967]